MNGENCIDLREPIELDDSAALAMVLAAYDHILFAAGGKSGWPSEAWSGALQELLGARSRILAGVIPMRLRAYRAWNTPVASAQVN